MIYTEDQLVKLGGVLLPGLVKSIEVTETAKIDAQEVEGSAAKPKQATGYEDAKIILELILDDTPEEEKYQKLSRIRRIFRGAGQGVPQPIPLVCEDTAVHGIDLVLFRELKHKAESKKNQLAVTLELWQYVRQTIQVEKQSGGGAVAPARKRSKPKNMKSETDKASTPTRKKVDFRDIPPPPKAVDAIRALLPGKGFP